MKIHASVTLLVAVLFAGSSRLARAQSVPQCGTAPGHIILTSVPSTLYSKLVPVNIYLPSCYDPNGMHVYPVIYLLHGGAADESQWPDLNVQVAADTLISQGSPPFVVVMPGAAYYEHIDYAAFVINDLMPGIEAQYRVDRSRTGRGIGGLSLGGYWALKTALLHPELFSAVGGYSPVVDPGYSDDLMRLVRKVKVDRLQPLKVALDVGNQDSLSYSTGVFAQALRARGLDVSATMGHGGHIRAYWRARTYDYFRFYLDTFAQFWM